MIRRPPRSTLDRSSAASDVYKRQALEWSLSALWRSWGIEPDVVVGHSIGEFAAAAVAGLFEIEVALRLAAERGRLMQSLPAGGAMVAVSAGDERVRAALEGEDGRAGI